MNIKLILIFIFVGAMSVSGAEGKVPKNFLKGPSLKGSGFVQVLNFNPTLNLVELISVSLPGEGSFWVNKKDLLKIAELDPSRDARTLAQLKVGSIKVRCKKIKLKEISIPTFMEDQSKEAAQGEPSSDEPLNPCDVEAKQ